MKNTKKLFVILGLVILAVAIGYIALSGNTKTFKGDLGSLTNPPSNPQQCGEADVNCWQTKLNAAQAALDTANAKVVTKQGAFDALGPQVTAAETDAANKKTAADRALMTFNQATGAPRTDYARNYKEAKALFEKLQKEYKKIKNPTPKQRQKMTEITAAFNAYTTAQTASDAANATRDRLKANLASALRELNAAKETAVQRTSERDSAQSGLTRARELQKPDLIVDGLGVTKYVAPKNAYSDYADWRGVGTSTFTAGEKIIFAGRLKNIGNVPVTSPPNALFAQIRFCMDMGENECVNYSYPNPPGVIGGSGQANLGVNESAWLTGAWVAIEGNHTVYACHVINNNIPELRTDNNCTYQNFTVLPPPPPPACTASEYTCAAWETCTAAGTQTGTNCTANAGVSCTPPVTGTQACTPPVTVGSLTGAAATDQPDSGIVVAGSTGVIFSRYNFSATNEAFTIKQLDVIGTTTERTAFTSFAPTTFASFTEGSDITRIGVSYTKKDGTTESVYALMSNGKASFTNLNFYIPKNGSATITILADINVIELGATSGTSFRLGLNEAETVAHNSFLAWGENSSEVLNAVSVGRLTNSASVNAMTVRKTVPTVAKLTTAGTKLNNGVNDIAAITIVADAKEAVSLKRLAFEFSSTATITVNSLEFYRKQGTTGSESALTGNVSIRNRVGANLKSGGTSLTTGTATTDTIYVTWDKTAWDQEFIARGTTHTYILRAIVSGAAVNTSLSTYIADDTVAVNNGTAEDIISSGANFVWSDNSAPSHTTSTNDWTNGKDIPFLPTQVTTLGF